jgi:hypothetical protein
MIVQPFSYFNTVISTSGVVTYTYRNDPYSASLVFATPGSQFSTLGMSSAWSDVSANIRGTGVNKTVATSASLQTGAQNNFAGVYSTSLNMTASSASPAPSIYSQNSTDFNFGSGNFTIELWFNPGTTTTQRRMFFQKYTTGTVSTSEIEWNIGLNSTNTMAIAYDGGGAETFVQGPTTSSLSTNTWYHFALVRNGATNFTIYSNGQGHAVATTNRTLNTTTTPAFLLGGNYNNPYENGYIQDYRIYKGVAKYTASFTPPLSMITTV